jgi:signal transduction histidine kinase
MIVTLVTVLSAVLVFGVLLFMYYLYRLFRPMECLVDFCRRFPHDRSQLPSCGGSGEISQLKDAVLGLLDANSKLIEQERDIFKAAAHEIKTPLAVLKARLSLFNRGEYDREEFVREANKDINRITAHLKELLFLKSIERILLGNEETMDIYTELEGLTLDFRPLLEKKSLQVFYGNKFTFRVVINKKALRKLLKAIGENIISYAEQGSVVFININPSKRTISFINKIGSEEDREMFSSQIGFKIIDHLSEKLGFSFATTAEAEKFTTTLIFNDRATA